MVHKKDFLCGMEVAQTIILMVNLQLSIKQQIIFVKIINSQNKLYPSHSPSGRLPQKTISLLSTL